MNITTGRTFYAPTGGYNRNNPVNNNIGHNFWTVEPQLNVTYLNAPGQELSTALAYDFNFRNDATGDKSGQEFSINYAIAQHLSEASTLGIAGYYYRQLGDDTRNGNVVFGTADQLAGHPDPFNNGGRQPRRSFLDWAGGELQLPEQGHLPLQVGTRGVRRQSTARRAVLVASDGSVLIIIA